MSDLRAHPGGKGWRGMLLRTEDGRRVRSNLHNAALAFENDPEWAGVLAYDEFRMRVVARRDPPWDVKLGSVWGDAHDRMACRWLQGIGIDVPEAVVSSAIQSVAMAKPFHPVRDWLESLRWDGTGRLDDWLVLYAGAASSDYVCAVGAKFLISAVARVMNPGAKVDTCLILEGVQGLGKSSLLSVLGGEWFSDEIAPPGSKDASMQLVGVWILELGELSSMTRSEVETIKAFMSRRVERFRPAYGRRVVEVPRQVVFAGSTNSGEYLRDESGGRRFWPVPCMTVRTAELKRDRDQLFAEALVRYRSGATWWLDDDAVILASKDEQAERYERDPWEEVVMPELRLETSTSVSEILERFVKKDPSLWTQKDTQRIGKLLKANGWVRYNAAPRGKTEWRYRRADEQLSTCRPGCRPG